MKVDVAVYRLACGHDIPAPPPELRDGDIPAFIECPVCGVPRRVLGYEAK